MKTENFFTSLEKLLQRKKKNPFFEICRERLFSLSPATTKKKRSSITSSSSSKSSSKAVNSSVMEGKDGGKNSLEESFFAFSTRLQESFSSFSLTKPLKIAQEEIAAYIFPECRDFYLVFVNGFLEKSLSKIPEEAKLLYLNEAFLEFHPFFQEFFSFAIKQEKKPLFLMNLSLGEQGAFLYIPKNKFLPPLQILSFEMALDQELEINQVEKKHKEQNQKKQTTLSLPTFQLYLGAKSTLDIVHTKISLKKESTSKSKEKLNVKAKGNEVLPKEAYVSSSLFFVLEEKARCNYQEMAISSSSESSFVSFDASFSKTSNMANTSKTLYAKTDKSFTSLRAIVKKEAKYSSKYISNQDGDCLDQKVFLKEEKAETQLFGLSWMKGKNTTHISNQVEHFAKKTRSKQLYKTIAEDKSFFHLLGQIIMQKEAEKSEAKQLNHNLLLSDEAMIDSRPYMDIFVDDVKASHGCTTANFPERLLFYMQSRGLSERVAKKLLLEAFCKEVIDQIEIKSVQKALLEQITPQAD